MRKNLYKPYIYSKNLLEISGFRDFDEENVCNMFRTLKLYL